MVFSFFSIYVPFSYFQQVNNNFLSAGNANKELTVLLLEATLIGVLILCFPIVYLSDTLHLSA